MDEREIICCGAGGWTKVIAWLQIVLNVFALTTSAMGLIYLIDLGPDEFNKSDLGTVLSSAGDAAYGIAITVFVLSIVVTSLAVAMGIILLRGAKERNTRYLRWWIIYAAICMTWGIFATIVNTGENFALSLSRLLFILGTYGFGIWVVRVHTDEIERYNAPAVYVGQQQYPVKVP